MRRMNSKSEKERERERGVREGSGGGEQPQHVRLVIIISATLGQWLKWCSRCRCRCRFNLHNEVVFIVAAPIGSALYLASRRQDYLCPPLYLPPLPSPLTLSPFLCVRFVLSHLAQTPNKIERCRTIARPRPFPPLAPLAPLPYLELLLLLLAVGVPNADAYMVYRYPMHHSLRFDAFLTDLRHIERILTLHHLTVSFSVLIIIISLTESLALAPMKVL